MIEVIERIKERGGNASYSAWKTFPDGFYEKAFVDRARVAPLESWSHESLKTWDYAPEEDYHQTVGPTIRLRLMRQATTEEVRKSVSFGVRQFLRSDPGNSLTVNWSFTEFPDYSLTR